MTDPTAYPLTWPTTFPRKKVREKSRFSSTLNAALSNVQDSLRKFGYDSNKKLERLIISSNVTLGVSNPLDPGVAVWFVWDSLQVCIPVDRYASVQANLQAIHHIIEARRVELRHGTLELVRASFHGFKALPASSRKPWWELLGIPAESSNDAIRDAYRNKMKLAHPDAGGSTAAAAELNAAYQEALAK
jgi:hypothetical protein